MRSLLMLAATSLGLACSGTTSEKQSFDTSDTSDTSVDTDSSDPITDRCVTPTADDHLYPPYPDVPDECVEDFWECPLEPDYATVNPSTVCSITEGFDADGALQARFWEAYNYSRDYFGAYGPVYVYFMGPTSEESNNDIWHLRAERRAIPEACYPVESQVDDFFDNPFGSEELDAANSGDNGYFSISGNSGCNPLMDLMMINPELDGIRTITMHEYNHIFQVGHMLSHDRDSDYGLSSWIMEGQATYSAARFGDETGWGPDFADLMMSMKKSGGNVSPDGIDDFLAANRSFDLEAEIYWERSDFSAAAVYYQLGSWAWAYLVHELDDNVDKVLKDFIQDVPVMGREASFQLHFDRTMDAFFEEFAVFVQGSDEEWQAILE
jgi:hypothetical protein